MYRYFLGAIVPLILIVWVVAGSLPADPQAGFESAKQDLHQRFSDWRGRVERAVARVAELAAEAEPRTLFRSAQAVVDEEQVTGVALLDLKGNARCWAGRTFSAPLFEEGVEPIPPGIDVVEVLVHPAHRVLMAARRVDGEVAVAFFVFDETFPQNSNLAADIARKAGLAAVELRYSAAVPLLPESTRPRDRTAIDGLVHATLWGRSDAELEVERIKTRDRRDRVLTVLLCALAAWVLWRKLGRPEPGRVLSALLAMTLLAGVRVAYSQDLWSGPVNILLTAALALAAALLLRRARLPWLAGAAGVVGALFIPRGYEALLRALVRQETALFDALHVMPGWDAAALLAAVCLLTLAVLFFADAVRRVLGPLPYLALAAGLLPWKGPLLAAAALLTSFALRRKVSRFERAASIIFLAALGSFPLLYNLHRVERAKLLAEDAGRLVSGQREEAEARVERAALRATDPDTGVHVYVTDAIARGSDPKHLAFELWSASDWSPVAPCAVQVWDMEGRLLSTFDFDSPPTRLLPGPPDPRNPGPSMLFGTGEGQAIHFYAYDFLLKTIGDERPVGIGRFVTPDRWDVMLSDLRPSMFSEPLDLLARHASKPLLLAELTLDGKRQRTSDRTTADFPRPTDEMLARVLKNNYAVAPMQYRGQDALLVLVRSEYRLGALVFGDNQLQQAGLAVAKVLLVFAAVCLLYGLVVLVDRRGPVVFLFRHRVAMFLALISIAPVVLLAAYDKGVAEQRYETEIAERLKRRLDLAENLLLELGADATNDWCTSFAANFGMDLNVYDGQELIATSRPGVWDTGLLARRLAARPYLALQIEDGTDLSGSEYFTRDTSLRAAYRKVRGPDVGLPAGGGKPLILMAPALEDRRELERRAAESNALLLAIYLTTAILAVFVSLYLARSLTRPVHQLREATQRVAEGDLSETLPEGRADEFGDLIRAFNRMTTEIRETQDLRVRVEKAAAWREMARQIAHEIKNPLTPIKLTVQNLLASHARSHDAFDADFQKGAKLILDQIDALQRIAGDFSAYARFPERAPEPVELHALVDEVAALFSQNGVKAEPGPEQSAERRRLVVEADRDELRRALINLVTNSQQAGATATTLAVKRQDQVAIITIVDNGAGIARADMERIWEPAFTTKSSGTGLGMPIVKRVIDDHGGEISIRSEPGRGTTVTIRLPLSRPRAEG